MKPKQLFSKISLVESLLDDVSFKQLNSEPVTALKFAFKKFTLQVSEAVAEESVAEGHHSTEAFPQNSNVLLVANATQDLRNPLNEIISFTDLLREDTIDPEQMGRINAFRSASHSLLEVIDELSEYAKLSRGLEQFKSINFNFYRLVRDVDYLCQTLIVKKNVTLELVIDTTIPEVLVGDPSRLSQVLLNLIGNIIKFIDEGQILLNVILEKKTDDKLIIAFTISINGFGIAAEQLPFIFDFYRQSGGGADVASNEATGLGLSVVKEIITQLGGDIAVADDTAKCTTVTCYLPYIVGDKAKLRKNDTEKEYLQDAAKMVQGARVLVFEDNPINQLFVKQRLKKWGCTVFVTEDGAYGLDLLEEQEIDIILMDLNMPVMSGLEITECIRKHERKAIRALPIIALTADFTVQDKEKSEMHGINDYLLKPYSPDELLLKLIANKNSIGNVSNLSDPIPSAISIKIEEPDVFSLDQTYTDCMEEIVLVEELVRLYKQNTLEFIGEIKYHLMQKDFETLDFSLHKMKSGLALMRTNDLLTIVEQMQNCSKTDRDLKHLDFLYACFVAEYPKTLSKIDSEVKRLQMNNK